MTEPPNTSTANIVPIISERPSPDENAERLAPERSIAHGTENVRGIPGIKPNEPLLNVDSRSPPTLGESESRANVKTESASVQPSNKPISHHPPSIDGMTTPRRRSVQFARTGTEREAQDTTQSRASSLAAPDDWEVSTPDRRGHSFLSKLRALAAYPSFPTHSRSASGATVGGEPSDSRYGGESSVPLSERAQFRFPRSVEDGSEADADGESSSEENKTRKKRKMKFRGRLPGDAGPRTEPSSPKTTERSPLPGSNSFSPPEDYNPNPLARRATMSSVQYHGREGVSEDEGRDRLKRDSMWRRRSGWLQSARGLSYGGTLRQEGRNSQDERRPSNLRRLTGFGNPSEGAEGITAAWRRHKAERGTSLSAQKWRQIKAGLKMIGQRKKPEPTVDHVKSAELLAELTSGVPAALLLASMFQRDEHGSRRIPILLEQLKVRITDSHFDSHSGDRHLVFRIELEYGSGMTRMKWVINRTLKDFANLHIKYKLQIGTQKYIHLRSQESGHTLPHFPRSAFPYLRGVRGLDSDAEDEEEDPGDDTAADATSGNERPSKKKKRRSSFAISRRQSSLASPPDGNAPVTNLDGVADATASGAPKRESYPEKQRKKLENYLQKMIRFLIFRPDSNRLCKFLELSALGVRLAAEGSYHGKEGFLIIQSSKGLDFRSALNPSMIKSRHSPKWFLVRHSYVVCVDSPEEMHIYDVFLVDPFFQIQAKKGRLRDKKPKEIAKSAKESAAHPQHHTLKLQNSERKLRLLARNERQLHQFEDSIRFMIESTPWSKPNRFDSFAPVRTKCFAQWLVDGRDYMWVVSRAINQAKDVIYIHDWWLSPELYMRRPAAISQKWRLDRLLQRKAQEGVKVFVIMYRNINSAIPIDSEYSKFSLLDLHPNVFVQRSPNQFRQNTFFWAHHEKLCIIDHTLAFIGGIDLCFGRWDTPQHLLTDDKLTGFELTDAPKDADHCQLWPGKDYSNPRVQDFYDLDKPYEEMYDREVVPRMPWHDIAMHVVGQPARDLTRHFVQRWNYILRQRKPTRPTPFLLPPPDFNPADLEALGLDGSCEVQVLRSSSTWSTGTPEVTEHSIMNAYVKMIEKSEHFVYIENQFFVSSCEVEGKKIENLIGDALVERIVRAARNEEDWRAVILIPLMPGFQNTVDTEGGTSVRLIMQCQYRSICRGETSIFGRLRAQGIEPEDYIQFFSLRSWGRIGPRKHFVTEQLYIHAKCMIVDDRVAIIGSANINERSMLGSRDSECAAIVRDTDLIWSTMAGKPYLVGRFPHTLRMRLMREHLGVDVDEIMEQEMGGEVESRKSRQENSDSCASEGPRDTDNWGEREDEREILERRHRLQDEFLARSEDMHSFNHDVDWEQANNPNLKSNRKLTADARVTRNASHRKDLEGFGVDQMQILHEAGQITGRDSFLGQDNVEYLKEVDVNEKQKLQKDSKQRSDSRLPTPSELNTQEEDHPSILEAANSPADVLNQQQMAFHNDDAASNQPTQANPLTQSNNCHLMLPASARPIIDKDCMKDPLCDAFYLDTWQAIAENNTKVFRMVFRCMPDSEVKSWKEYKEYTAYAERFADMQNNYFYDENAPHLQPSGGSKLQSGPPGAGVTSTVGKVGHDVEKIGSEAKQVVANHLSNEASAEDSLKQWAAEANRAQIERQQEELAKVETLGEKEALKAVETKSSQSSGNVEPSVAFPDVDKALERQRSGAQTNGYPDALALNGSLSQRRRRRGTTRSSKREFHASDDIISMHEAEELLGMVQGHLVLWPYEWLEREEQGGNWLYTLDQISPLEIYN
ncbi:phospholipase D1 [Coccidioides immitis RS]|uniref:Phospholipase D1 n=1 Tax=Coccidioides immitis (strain RS) TaxID=246410 RepID=J3KKL0_COCIM|nr:phospholipase D1 [Coccidioides immitis RS]EAS36720.3 phospholipase D1 [Coccidioides immitis RS]TPX25177.1 Phospholipase D1 [Coccidioides immitis]